MARITFQKRQKEIKRKEKQQLKAEKRAQRKIAKSVEPYAAEQIFSPDNDQPEEPIAPVDGYLDAGGIEKQMQPDGIKTAVDSWVKSDDQGSSARKATSS